MTVSTVATLAVVAVHPIQRPEHPVIGWLDEHAQQGDTAVVAFGAPNILQATGLRSPYPDLWSLPVRVHDPELRELGALLDVDDDRERQLRAAGPRDKGWIAAVAREVAPVGRRGHRCASQSASTGARPVESLGLGRR